MPNTHPSQRPRRRAELASWYAAVLEEQEKSGLSVASFASKIGVTSATLYQWRRRLGAQAEVNEDENAVHAGSTGGLIQVTLKESSPPTARDHFVVHLGSSHRVEVPQDFHPSALEQLLTILGSC